MINIKNLFKSFKSNNWTEVIIYKDLNLEIKDWDFISILGASWSWKTTLLNLISWLDEFEEWEIKINQYFLHNMNNSEKTKFRWQNISFIFQQFNLIDNLTVEENIDLVIDLNKLKRRYETRDILKIVGLENKINSFPFNLSWWEQQRVAVARAFVWDTPILLADEPTWNLDKKNSEIITELILKLHRESNNTIIMITHDTKMAEIANKTYYLEENSLIIKK